MTRPMFALVDCNNFFVSCERLFRPSSRDMPVVVLSSNDGCAVARSNEAKALGIQMGAPLHELKRRFSIIDGTTMRPTGRSCLPSVIAFSANFELYGDISRRVAAVLIRATPRLELYSIDEAFLDISQLDISDYGMWGRELAAKIKREVGIPVSVGIAPTKTLCKIAADHAKKHTEYQSAFRIEARGMSQETRAEAMPLRDKSGNLVKNPSRSDTNSTLDSYLSALTSVGIADIWGIGWRLAPRLRAEGIHTAADLAALAPRRAQQLMGIHGRRIVSELRGTSCIPLVTTHTPRQVISRGRQFGHDTSDLNVISAAVAHMTNHACQALRREGLLASHATVWLMTNRKKPGYTVLHRDTRFYTPTADTGTVARQLIRTLQHDFDTHRAWHKAEVTLWGLLPDGVLQTDLFGTVQPEQHTRSTALMAALDAINDKHGKATLHYAAEDLSHSWYPRRTMQSPPYTTDWRHLPILRASSPLS